MHWYARGYCPGDAEVSKCVLRWRERVGCLCQVVGFDDHGDVLGCCDVGLLRCWIDLGCVNGDCGWLEGVSACIHLLYLV